MNPIASIIQCNVLVKGLLSGFLVKPLVSIVVGEDILKNNKMSNYLKISVMENKNFQYTFINFRNPILKIIDRMI
jgi:hypothetical protein